MTREGDVYWDTLNLEPAFAQLIREGIPTPLDVIKHITRARLAAHQPRW